MTLSQLRREISTRLDEGEAAELMRFFLHLTTAEILSDREFVKDRLPLLMEAVERREKGEPLQYILGEWDFCGRRILCQPGVLIPREDTEALYLCGAEFLKDKQSPLILEICCGSGAVGLTLAREFCAEAVLTDIEPKALDLAQKNAELFDVAHRVCIAKKDARYDYDFSAELKTLQTDKTKFDAVFSNPPYIPHDDLASLDPSVRDYEPMLALDGGQDGLDFYRILAEKVQTVLKKGGLFAVEIGKHQEKDVTFIFEEAGFEHITCFCDLAGIIRVVAAYLPLE